MTSLEKLAENRATRILLVGYPGSGKTGSLACLANAGYKLRILDYDGNLDPLFEYIKPDCLKNVDVVTLEDKLRLGQRIIETSGLPEAFANGLKMMNHWKYKAPDGTEVDLGKSRDWGPDTIVVLDSMTGMGRAAMRRALSFANRTTLNRRRQDWGVAASEQEQYIEMLTGKLNDFHVIVTAHLKMIGPEIEEAGDSDLTKDLKQRTADLVKTRLFPTALGKALPQSVAEHFPVTLLMEAEVRGNKVRRVICTLPRPELDLKVPANLPSDTFDLKDGMLTILQALTGGDKKCPKDKGTTTKAS